MPPLPRSSNDSDHLFNSRIPSSDTVASAAKEVEDVLAVYLKKMGDKYDVSKNVEVGQLDYTHTFSIVSRPYCDCLMFDGMI